MSGVTTSLDELHALIARILVAHRTSPENAAMVAAALTAAEADGQPGHGASRVASYAGQSQSGKVDGYAVPSSKRVAGAGVRVDAKTGFFYPAHKLAVQELCALAPETGIAAAIVANSHHSGVAGHHVEPLAEAGLIGISFGNGPQAMAPWGGKKGLFGTNPIAFAAPRAKQPPLLIDMSMSVVARGKINVAAQNGTPLGEGWAFDAEGNPTTDAKAAMAGTMAPVGGPKGANLALMIELLCGALAAGNFGYESSSFFSAEGEPPRNAQLLIAIAPNPFSGGAFLDRIEDMLTEMAKQPGVRVPGTRRLGTREAAARDGVTIPSGLYDQLLSMAG